MIAKIYPDGHPDLLGKKDPTHPVRYFDIRKLTPTECFRLMGVSDNDIEKIKQSGLSKSACYKLAGNSIVVDCLYYIYRNIWLTEDEQPQTGDVMSLFAESTFRAPLPKTINMVTLCSGYDSQCLAMERLVSDAKQKGYDVSFDLKAWSEFDPESRSALEKQPAVVAHNSLFPQFADRNVGDMTKADWSFLKGEDIDLLTYSTPCQSISQAGKRTGIKRVAVHALLSCGTPRMLSVHCVLSFSCKRMFVRWLTRLMSTISRNGRRCARIVAIRIIGLL